MLWKKIKDFIFHELKHITWIIFLKINNNNELAKIIIKTNYKKYKNIKIQ